MKILIEQAENGASVKTIWNADGEKTTELSVYNFLDCSDDELDGLVTLLYKVKDLLSERNKYGEKQIEIRISHGSHYDCKNDKCSICKEIE